MVRKLFEDFLDSAEQYEACELYWEQLVRDIAESLGQTREWQRWIPRHYADGTPFERDGNPIFDGRSQELNRAFRIIQHPAVGNDLEITAWLKSYEEEYADLPADELVINLSLSEESAQLTQALLRKWMTPTTTTEEMQSFIRELLAP
ncbi:MAG TPA: hypothetical protein VLA19_27560 [Herpetosiphonaceae bacterium]|nr:hypothetical protein [Herpetosiphonaceae bacterium]